MTKKTHYLFIALLANCMTSPTHAIDNFTIIGVGLGYGGIVAAAGFFSGRHFEKVRPEKIKEKAAQRTQEEYVKHLHSLQTIEHTLTAIPQDLNDIYTYAQGIGGLRPLHKLSLYCNDVEQRHTQMDVSCFTQAEKDQLENQRKNLTLLRIALGKLKAEYYVQEEQTYRTFQQQKKLYEQEIQSKADTTHLTLEKTRA